MQIKSNQIVHSKHHDEDEENKLKVSKKKPSLLKKKKSPYVKLFSNIDFKNIVNIGNICFFNEEAVRYPDSSDETLLKALYHYNMISKVTLNKSFMNISIKKNNQNFLPPQYFFERLRSFGDKQMANMATHLEKIHNQFSMIRDSCPVKQQTFNRQNEQALFNKFLASKQGKKCFIYYSEISPEKITMKNIFFSIPLLQALGCDVKNIGLDFLKYKHVFFEVFTAKNYANFMEKCFENYATIQDQLMKNPNMPQEQRNQRNKIYYDDEVIRRVEGPGGIFEETSKAKVLWYSPHPSICCFQILDMDENGFSTNPKKRKLDMLQETRPEQELELLKKIGIDCSMLSIQQNPVSRLPIQNFQENNSLSVLTKPNLSQQPEFSVYSNGKMESTDQWQNMQAQEVQNA